MRKGMTGFELFAWLAITAVVLTVMYVYLKDKEMEDRIANAMVPYRLCEQLDSPADLKKSVIEDLQRRRIDLYTAKQKDITVIVNRLVMCKDEYFQASVPKKNN